jgi:hypothetical protein
MVKQWMQRMKLRHHSLTNVFVTGIVLLAAISMWFAMPLAARADGGAPNLAYVSIGSGGVSVVDVQQQQVVKSIRVPGNIHMISLSLDGRFLYVTQPEQNKVSIIAAKTGGVVCSATVAGGPEFVVLDSTTNMIYAAGSGAAGVSIIDDTNCDVKYRVSTSGGVYGLAVATTGASGSGDNQLWVSTGHSINVFDDRNGKALGTIAMTQEPRYLSAPPGATIYATTAQGSVVSIDVVSHKVTTLITGGQYGPMDYDATTGEVYVPDQKNKQVDVLAPVASGFKAPSEPERVMKLPVAPVSVAITNDGQLGFVALANDRMDMYDIPGKQLIATIQVKGDPRFIIAGLYPPAFGTTPDQASFLDTLVTSVGYVIVAILLIVPIILFWRFSRKRKKEDPVRGQEVPLPAESRNIKDSATVNQGNVEEKNS